MLLAAPVSHAAAPGPSDLTVEVSYGGLPLSGINIAICRVATREGGGDYKPVPDFAGVEADFSKFMTAEENLALATVLNAVADARGVARESKITDADGKAKFTGLPAGMYLVARVSGGSGNSEYIVLPYIVCVPLLDSEGEWDYDVVSHPKVAKHGVDKLDINVYKMWMGTNPHPDSVDVQLYKDGDPYGDPVRLNADNGWTHTWLDLGAGTWTVDELNPPAGYTKAISGSASGGSFVIMNIEDETPTPDPNHEPSAKVVISGKKTWDHGKNAEASRPKSITLFILADGKVAVQKEITAAQEWSWSEELDKYGYDGHEIVYTVDEARIENYGKKISGHSIKNTYSPGWDTDKGPPPTGDGLNTLLWVLVMGVSAAVMAVLAARRRRQASPVKSKGNDYDGPKR